MTLKQRKKRELNRFVNKAREEIRKYNQTGDDIYLRQAGNKLYNAYLLLIEHKYDVELSANEFGPYANDWEKKSKKFAELRIITFGLHIYFYEGRGDEIYVRKQCNRAIVLIKGLVRAS